MFILEAVFSGSRHTLYCASVNLSTLSRHQSPNPSSTFSPVPVYWFHICLMTWFLKAKMTARRASTFTLHGILKMSQFLFTTSCYRLSLILGSRGIYLGNFFSREEVSAKLFLSLLNPKYGELPVHRHIFFFFLLEVSFLRTRERARSRRKTVKRAWKKKDVF